MKLGVLEEHVLARERRNEALRESRVRHKEHAEGLERQLEALRQQRAPTAPPSAALRRWQHVAKRKHVLVQAQRDKALRAARHQSKLRHKGHAEDLERQLEELRQQLAPTAPPSPARQEQRNEARQAAQSKVRHAEQVEEDLERQAPKGPPSAARKRWRKLSAAIHVTNNFHAGVTVVQARAEEERASRRRRREGIARAQLNRTVSTQRLSDAIAARHSSRRTRTRGGMTHREWARKRRKQQDTRKKKKKKKETLSLRAAARAVLFTRRIQPGSGSSIHPSS